MIVEIATLKIKLPYECQGSLYLPRGLLNPDGFNDLYLSVPWYPFEDFVFTSEDVFRIFELESVLGTIYRSELPSEGRVPKAYRFDNPDRVDATRLLNWLTLDEGVIWSTSGMLIINSFADYVVLAMSDNVAERIFGQTTQVLYAESASIFKDNPQADPAIESFMHAVQKTWANDG